MTDLKQAADAMFADLELLDLLQRHGDLRLHGAYEMDLMTWPEIDVWIFNDAFASADAWKLVGALAEVAPPTHVHVINQLDHDLGKTPPDCVSIDYRFRYGDLQWKLDICIGSAARHEPGLEYLKHVVPQLTSEKRAAILAIKELAMRSRWYRKSRWYYAQGQKQMIGVDIYRAVLFEGVQTPAEFVNFIWQHKGIDISADFGLPPGAFSIVASP
ncbi:MAG: hypothetical protein KF688_17960 [Pirellulales bacterium]|nr:hypothetical protein [Pirellulales bacterium]